MRTMFILFTLLCVVSQLIASNNKTQEIRGKVVDKVTGAPLKGVAISLADTKIPIGTISDEKGEFCLWGVSSDIQNLCISFDGYKLAFIDYSVIGNSDESPFVIELVENKERAKKKFSLSNLFKGKKADASLAVFASE